MSSKSDLQRATVNWQNRIAQARSAGIPDSAWKSLMAKDMASIAAGHSPMANADVNDAIRSVVGQSPIKDPQPSTSDIFDILGNIPSDIRDIVTGAPAGIVKYVTTLPQQAYDFLHMADPAMQKKYGMETGDKWSALWNDPAGFIRDLSREPVFGPLVPGLSTAASLTSSTGRKQLEQHPVSAAIDVGAAISALGKLGLFGKAAAEGEEAAKAATAEKGLAETIQNPPRKEMTPLAALQRGEAFKAVGRTTLDIGEHVPFVKMTRQSIRDMLVKTGWHPDLAEFLGRPWMEIRNVQLRKMNRLIKSDFIRPLLQLEKEDPEKFAVFNRIESGESLITPEDKQLLAESSAPQTGEDIGPPPNNDPSSPEYQAWRASQGQAAATQPLLDASGNITAAARQLVDDPNADPAVKAVIQKYLDQEAFNSDINLQTLDMRSRRFMSKLAEENPDLVKVRSEWGREYWYRKGHPVANSWDRYRRMMSVQWDAEDALSKAHSERALLQDTPGTSAQKLEGAVAKEKAAIDRYEKAGTAAGKAKGLYNKRLAAYAPKSYDPLLDPKARQLAVEEVGRQFEAGKPQGKFNTYEEAINNIEASTDWRFLADSVGVDEMRRIETEVNATWSTIAKQAGYDPLYLPNRIGRTDKSVFFPTVVAKSPSAKAAMGKQSAMNLSRSTYNVTIGLLEAERQMLTEWGTREFAENWVKKLWTIPAADKNREIYNAVVNGGDTSAGIDARTVASQEVRRHYKNWDPDKFGFAAYFPGGDYVIHEGVEKALTHMMSTEDRIDPFRVGYDKAMKVWRFSVLTTPRHMSHILLGGLMMGIVRDPLFIPHFIGNFKEALGIMHGDDDVLLAKFGGNVNDFEPDQLLLTAGGKTLGRWSQRLSNIPRKINQFEESATQMYKITTYLSHGRGQEGIELANKMFVDMNAMTPFERTVIRKMFPFYGFTRHLFRYLMTMPADHPLTSAILTNFANQHWSDWNSGLPQSLSFMFFLGPPDKNGMTTAIDYRSIDPFRSFYNDFTLAGFFSQMNPVFQFAAQQAGVNVLSATPELYPNTHYDPNTGQMIADQPGSIPLRILEAVVPQSQALDAYLGLSDQFRNLKLTDPDAYRARVFSTLGLPFVPQTNYNVTRKIQSAQMKRFKDAQTEISQAIQTGDFSKVKRYGYVPTPTLLAPWLGNAKYVTPAHVESIYNMLVHELGVQTGTSLHAVLPKPTRTRTS